MGVDDSAVSVERRKVARLHLRIANVRKDQALTLQSVVRKALRDASASVKPASVKQKA